MIGNKEKTMEKENYTTKNPARLARQARFASCLLAVLSVCLSVSLGSSSSGDEPSEAYTPEAFDSHESMRAELAKIRRAYQPFLRSLPAALDVREQIPIAGTWRFAYEPRAIHRSQPKLPGTCTGRKDHAVSDIAPQVVGLCHVLCGRGNGGV